MAMLLFVIRLSLRLGLMFRYLNVGDGNLSSKKVKKCTGELLVKLRQIDYRPWPSHGRGFLIKLVNFFLRSIINFPYFEWRNAN